MPNIICKIYVSLTWEAIVALVYILLFVTAAIVAGFFWGRNTIKQDAIRTERDDAQLDKLHKLRS
jgi:hypothetical protein